MEYRIYELENGLRVVHRPAEGAVAYVGYRIGVGSGHEAADEEGLAHLCEHLAFKGTERRRAWQIMSTLERVGGDLNAFTTKEDTTFHAAVLRQDVPLAVDLLTDIAFHSTCPERELEKEREVVCEEIESYNDTPSELIYDDFENLLFPDHPLGHNILGRAEQVRQYTAEDVRRFTQRHYRPDNAVLFLYGGELPDLEAVAKMLPCRKASSCGMTGRPLPEGTAPEGQTIVRPMGTHQAHVMMGCRAYPMGHPLRMSLYLLNNLLGGPGMNARLNMLLRERHGLVYTVESSLTSYQQAGLWTTYFGCDADHVDRCRRLVEKELERIIAQPLTERQLQAAKRQLKGQLGVACDNREAFALNFSKSFLHNGEPRDLMALLPEIDALTPDMLQHAARETWQEGRLTTLVYQ